MVLRRLAIALCLAVCACAPAQAEPSVTLRAVFVNPGKTGEVFWDMVAESMQAAGRSLAIEVEVLTAERNFRRMQQLGFEVVARDAKPDFLILVNEEAAAGPVLEAADKAGIKTVLLSNTLVGDDARRLGSPREKLSNWIGSIVPDIDQAGARMATALIEAARAADMHDRDGKIHLLAIAGDERTPASIARNRGLERRVSLAPDTVIDRMLFANWNEAEGEAAARNFLTWAQRKGIRVAGIWAGNDAMAIGAINAARSLSLVPGKDLYIVGLNWSPEGLAKVANGELLMSDGGHFMQGAWSMVLLRDYADGCDFAQPLAIRTFRTSAVTRADAHVMHELIAGRKFAAVDYRLLQSRRGTTCGHNDFSAEALLAAHSARMGE